jgi:type IV pilus assembly protein PilA
MLKGYQVFTAVLVGCVIAYLIYFIRGRIKARRIGSKERPSIVGLAVFIILIFYVLVKVLPNFRSFNAPPKQSEAKTNLGSIYVAQLIYFSNTNTYASGSDTFKLIQWEPAGNNRYAYYCQGAMIPNKLDMHIDYVPKPDGRWPVDLKPQSSKSGFTCMAVGNIDKDEKLDVWFINDAKILINNQNDI